MTMVNLKAKPFYLKEDAIRWVEETRASMTLEQAERYQARDVI